MSQIPRLSEDGGDRSPLPRPPLTTREKVLYSTGYFGVSVLSGLVLLWGNYRYGALFTGTGKALVGLAFLVARLLDAPSDPLAGWWSDRTRSPLGRRRPFIAYGTPPLILTFALFWTPPAGTDSVWNLVWLVGMGTLFFLLFSVVVNPYLAMLPDIARSSSERVVLAAMIAGFGLGAHVVTMVAGSYLIGHIGFMAVAVIAAIVALVALLLPLSVKESGFSNQQSIPEFGLVQAIQATLANGPFRVYIISKCLFWIGVHSALAVAPFFVRGVLGYTEEKEVSAQTAALVAFAAGPAFIWFALMKPLAHLFSKRRLSLAGLLVLAVVAVLMTTVGIMPLPPLSWARLLMVCGSFAVAVVFSIPNAILADLIDLDQRITGVRREAMYFGAQGFFVKASWGGSSLMVMAAQGIFHGNLALASRVTWVAVALAAMLAFVVFRRFPEDHILVRMNEDRCRVDSPPQISPNN
ncbi:MAG: MFS transporter [Candidatus Zipacnadales bacterium]